MISNHIQVFALASNLTKIFYSVQLKNHQQKQVESTIKWGILCCHCENSSKSVWVQIIVDFEFIQNKQLEFQYWLIQLNLKLIL